MSSAGEEARQPFTDELFSIGPAARVLTSATGLLFSGSSRAEDQSLNVSINSADLPPTCHALPILPINQINPTRSVPGVGRDGGGGETDEAIGSGGKEVKKKNGGNEGRTGR